MHRTNLVVENKWVVPTAKTLLNPPTWRKKKQRKVGANGVFIQHHELAVIHHTLLFLWLVLSGMFQSYERNNKERKIKSLWRCIYFDFYKEKLSQHSTQKITNFPKTRSSKTTLWAYLRQDELGPSPWCRPLYQTQTDVLCLISCQFITIRGPGVVWRLYSKVGALSICVSLYVFLGCNTVVLLRLA